MATTLIVDFTIPVEHQPDVFGAMGELASVRAQQPGHLETTVFVDEHDPAHFIEVARWESADLHQAWMTLLRDRYAFDELAQLFGGPPTMTYARAV